MTPALVLGIVAICVLMWWWRRSPQKDEPATTEDPATPEPTPTPTPSEKDPQNTDSPGNTVTPTNPDSPPVTPNPAPGPAKPSVGPVERFTLMENQDVLGTTFNVGTRSDNATLENCAQTCLSNSSCKGFARIGNQCWYKSHADTTSAPGVSFYKLI